MVVHNAQETVHGDRAVFGIYARGKSFLLHLSKHLLSRASSSTLPPHVDKINCSWENTRSMDALDG